MVSWLRSVCRVHLAEGGSREQRERGDETDGRERVEDHDVAEPVATGDREDGSDRGREAAAGGEQCPHPQLPPFARRSSASSRAARESPRCLAWTASLAQATLNRSAWSGFSRNDA